VARRLPITVRWSHRPGIVTVELPGISFVAVVERDGSHLSVMLTRAESEQLRASLADTLSISGGDQQQ
jgi:hypothetical protein